MKKELQQQLYETAPVLYGLVKDSPLWKISASDDLFPFLLELSTAIEKFNRRYRKRYVRVMRIRMIEGKLEFLTHRPVACIEKLIAATRLRIRRYRKEIRSNFIRRARKMQSTALFGSSLLPEWNALMPDELRTLECLLGYAERFAVSKGDWLTVAHWYRRYLHDGDNELRCLENSERCE